ncbi:MAG: initiation factor 2B [Melioribacteraceae bacterium]|nr:MAG: initiation factor 2B [Melioribacteraceae bacterium]
MDKNSEQILQNITSGSEELLDSIITHISTNSDEEESEFIAQCRKMFPHFKTVTSFLDSYMQIKPEAKREFLNEYLDRRKQGFAKILINASTYLGKYNKFVTISNSKTVVSVLSYISKNAKHIKVTVCESRPNNEGVILAEKLSIEGITTSLITEAQLPDHIANCDAVILGADKILANHDVINKTGSKLLAILARGYKKPVYVISSKSKLTDEFVWEKDEQPTAEIYGKSNINLHIFNNYFELVPSYLITKIITD